MHPVLIGTIVWLIVGIIVGWLVLRHVAAQSPEGKQKENQKYLFLVTQDRLSRIDYEWNIHVVDVGYKLPSSNVPPYLTENGTSLKIFIFSYFCITPQQHPAILFK